jgi:cob(I)alamin adenosyltransferase
MKLYTRSGDDGTTGLFGGGRVGKDHPRVEAYGTVDELNSCIGLAAAACDPSHAVCRSILAIFAELQSRLFDIGADLATPQGASHEAKILRVGEQHVAEAERWIDQIDGGNSAMKTFVMPGGTELAARLHLARTVCRRAERAMVHLSRTEAVNPQAIIYMNRISDLLFAMARRANKEAGAPDVPWTPCKQ